MAKIGIMGGTFDPIHLGHLQMAQESLRQAGLDQVLFMPSKIPPHKRERKITPETQRADMVCLAIQGKPEFVYSDVELRREGTTYTVETLRFLQNGHPAHDYYFIMGSDSLWQIEQWYQPAEIMRRAVILAVGREGLSARQMQEKVAQLTEKYQANIQIIDMPRVDISSSQIRERVQSGQSIEALVPGEVAEYIQRHSLYRS